MKVVTIAAPVHRVVLTLNEGCEADLIKLVIEPQKPAH